MIHCQMIFQGTMLTKGHMLVIHN